MKANLTRGNSITENYQVTVEDCFINAMSTICELKRLYMERKKPTPNYPKGTPIDGPEIVQGKKSVTLITDKGNFRADLSLLANI